MSKTKGGVIVVRRPESTLMDRLYIPAILKGLVITMGHLFRAMFFESRFDIENQGAITQQYPEVPTRTAENYRGAPVLVKNPEGKVKCVSCQLCEFICPPKAIKIIPGEIPSDDPWAKVEKRPKEFDIDMIRCIYCGMCEEVCPEQAIFLRKDYAITGLSRQEMVHNKKRLYEIGGQRVGLVNKWNELK